MSINLNLELTDHCNISCKMCSQSLRSEAHGVPNRFMDWDTWRQALQGLAHMKQEIALCPHWLGEPTIHPEFDRFVEYAFATNQNNRLFREFKLHTNAVVFNEKRARLLIRLANRSDMAADTFRFIHFSIDAFSAPVYEVVKGADKRDLVYKNIERFIELKHQLGAKRPHATIAFVVQPDNAHEALAFRDHWHARLLNVGIEARQTWDWPDQEADTIYFRPLNCGEQDQADLLHSEVVRKLGLTNRNQTRLRSLASF